MKDGALFAAMFACSSALASSTFDEPAAAFPFPQHLTYAAGTTRPNHRSQSQQDDDVRQAYQRWKTRYLVQQDGAGAARYRIAFGERGSPAHAVTVSEGQGYGMVAVATMAGDQPGTKAIFDGLLRFVLDHPSVIDPRLMAWRVTDGGAPTDSAFDGDADIAYGLLLAAAQWGNDGEFDYLAAARRIIAGIAESTIGPDSALPMLGDWVEPDGSRYNQYTPRTSDFMPASFRAFARIDKGQRFARVITSIQRQINSLQRRFSPVTGLLPDFVEPLSTSDHRPRPAKPGFLEGPHDGHYYYNAGRDPWRVGMDALLNGDPISLAQVRKISGWALRAAGGKPAKIRSGYRLDGTPIADGRYFSIFFAAPLGIAAMTLPSQQSWLNALYDSVRSRHEGYFEDTVALLCLLLMTGNFWDPTAAPGSRDTIESSGEAPIVTRSAS